jgi:hypothetical protein
MWMIKRVNTELYLLVGNKPVWVPITEATMFPVLAEAERAQMTPMIWADSLVVEAPEQVPEVPLPAPGATHFHNDDIKPPGDPKPLVGEVSLPKPLVGEVSLPKLRDIPPRQLRGVQVLERNGTLFYAVEEGFCVIRMLGDPVTMVAMVTGIKKQRNIETFVSAMSGIHYQAQGGMRATVELRDMEVI